MTSVNALLHWILSGAFKRAVRWKWLAINPVTQAEPPPMPRPNPQPQSPEEAAQLVLEAFRRDFFWGCLVWLPMTVGARRGEICALRWTDIDRAAGTIGIKRAITVTDDGDLVEKDTKTHQQRRVAADPETHALLQDLWDVSRPHTDELGVELLPDAFLFSLDPDGSTPLRPNSVTQRYDRMAKRLGIDTTLHNLRHYSATELINAGVDVRTVAGRLGHGGGGAATNLRVYAAWLAEAGQRAAKSLAVRMPERQSATVTTLDTATMPSQTTQPAQPRGPYQQIASDLSGAIAIGALKPGDAIPTTKTIAARYQVSVATAHRAVAELAAEGLVMVSRGKRAVVAEAREAS